MCHIDPRDQTSNFTTSKLHGVVHALFCLSITGDCIAFLHLALEAEGR